MHFRAFCVAGPVAWNSLPLDIRSAPTLSTFKNTLKTHLFSHSYFTDCFAEYEQRTLYGALVVTLARLICPINCRFIIIIIMPCWQRHTSLSQSLHQFRLTLAITEQTCGIRSRLVSRQDIVADCWIDGLCESIGSAHCGHGGSRSGCSLTVADWHSAGRDTVVARLCSAPY